MTSWEATKKRQILKDGRKTAMVFFLGILAGVVLVVVLSRFVLLSLAERLIEEIVHRPEPAEQNPAATEIKPPTSTTVFSGPKAKPVIKGPTGPPPNY